MGTRNVCFYQSCDVGARGTAGALSTLLSDVMVAERLGSEDECSLMPSSSAEWKGALAKSGNLP